VLQPFRVLTPANVEEASAELVRLGERAMIYAGGAELILLLRYGMVHAGYLINIKGIDGLSEIGWDGRTVQIGATVTHRRLETDSLIRERLPLLADAESRIANIRVRNQGTLGGNLCFNDPHSDPGTALLLHVLVLVTRKQVEQEMSELREHAQKGKKVSDLIPGFVNALAYTGNCQMNSNKERHGSWERGGSVSAIHVLSFV
jgi:CO/xanthine dehydrogenase FAD-binding subunit